MIERVSFHYGLREDGAIYPIDIDDYEELRQATTEERRRVGWDEIGGKKVSTVFLNISAMFDENNTPVLFETAIWDSEKGWEPIERYLDYKTAKKTHQEIVRRLREVDETVKDLG